MYKKRRKTIDRSIQVVNVPGKIGPMCSESITGPRAQSLLMGSHETDTRNPISLHVRVYDAVVAPSISLCSPSRLVCTHKYSHSTSWLDRVEEK